MLLATHFRQPIAALSLHLYVYLFSRFHLCFNMDCPSINFSSSAMRLFGQMHSPPRQSKAQACLGELSPLLA